jgi:hypothetical protein
MIFRIDRSAGASGMPEWAIEFKNKNTNISRIIKKPKNYKDNESLAVGFLSVIYIKVPGCSEIYLFLGFAWY